MAFHTIHFYGEASATHTLALGPSWTSATWSATVTSASAPVGSKAVSLYVQINWNANETGQSAGRFFLGNATSSIPTWNKAYSQMFLSEVSSATGNQFYQGATIIVPLNNAREFKYYYRPDTPITTATIFISEMGYYY